MKWMYRLILALIAFFVGATTVVLWGAYMTTDADTLLTGGAQNRSVSYPQIGSTSAMCIELEGGSRLMVPYGVLNTRAVSLPQPPYPQEALTARISGEVRILVTISETGRVMWAHAESGHPLLVAAAMKVVCQARFEPVRYSEHAQEANGVVIYRFDLS